MSTQPGDNGGHFPDLQTARAYIEGTKGSNTSADYHRDRMRALRLLVKSAKLDKPVRILDFGCGDGMAVKELFDKGSVAKVVGVDVSAAMVQLATENLRSFPFEGRVGGADALKSVDGPFDLCFANDVLGYLDDSEADTFYRDAARLVRPGGRLIVMYGNELFDMFALNSGTAAFFERHFDVDATDLLTEGRSPQYKTATRKNPLSYGAELKAYGFREIKQAFSQWHKVPPAIGNRSSDVAAARLSMRDHTFDPNELAPRDAWKALFRSSIFASLSERV